MALLDFNYLIVANQRFDPVTLQETVAFFHSLGIRTLIFTVSADRDRHAVPLILERIRQVKEILRSIRPRGMDIAVYAELQMTECFSEDPQLLRLSAGHSRHLFVKLPLFCSDEWIHMDLNTLLFRRHISPVFTCFESNLKTNSSRLTDQLLKSHSFFGCFDLNYLCAQGTQDLLIEMLGRNIRIFPCISYDLSNYVGIQKSFQLLEQRIGTNRYVSLCQALRQSKNEILTPILGSR